MDSENSFDLVVVGTGIAGLFGALTAAVDRHVLVLSKGPIGASSSYLAQGGVAAATRSGDSPELHADDTIRADRRPRRAGRWLRRRAWARGGPYSAPRFQR